MRVGAYLSVTVQCTTIVGFELSSPVQSCVEQNTSILVLLPVTKFARPCPPFSVSLAYSIECISVVGVYDRFVGYSIWSRIHKGLREGGSLSGVYVWKLRDFSGISNSEQTEGTATSCFRIAQPTAE
jgi:hypothetical protein